MNKKNKNIIYALVLIIIAGASLYYFNKNKTQTANILTPENNPENIIKKIDDLENDEEAIDLMIEDLEELTF
jgi:hypothetical protein